jgi:hypothetical protein
MPKNEQGNGAAGEKEKDTWYTRDYTIYMDRNERWERETVSRFVDE